MIKKMHVKACGTFYCVLGIFNTFTCNFHFQEHSGIMFSFWIQLGFLLLVVLGYYNLPSLLCPRNIFVESRSDDCTMS